MFTRALSRQPTKAPTFITIYPVVYCILSSNVLLDLVYRARMTEVQSTYFNCCVYGVLIDVFLFCARFPLWWSLMCNLPVSRLLPWHLPWSDLFSVRTDLACHWASSTGLTTVSKFKPRLPAQWTVGTHRKGPSRMEKVTSRMNWPIRNSTQVCNWI